MSGHDRSDGYDGYKNAALFWEDRYRTQHKTVHRLEDEIARLCGVLEGIADLETDGVQFGNGWDSFKRVVLEAREALAHNLAHP